MPVPTAAVSGLAEAAEAVRLAQEVCCETARVVERSRAACRAACRISERASTLTRETRALLDEA
jgi:hypothetical protein